MRHVAFAISLLAFCIAHVVGAERKKASKAGENDRKELTVEIQPAKRYIKWNHSVPITNQLKDGEMYAY